MIVSFAVLEPDLLRERMRPGGKKPPFSLRIFSLVLHFCSDVHLCVILSGGTSTVGPLL
jgi:hypothetical protein